MPSSADWLLTGLTDFHRFVTSAESLSGTQGVLQGMDARFKSASALALIISSVFLNSFLAIALIIALAVIAAMASKVDLSALTVWIWIPVLTFTGFIALPAVFTTPGATIAKLPLLGWGIQAQGLHTAARLVLRSEAATTISVLTALTTPWTRLLKALRMLRVPVIFVVILATTHRYLFLLVESASEMSESRLARTVGPLDSKERRRIAGATAGVLLSKAFQWSTEIHMAMLSRGYRGEVYLLEEFQAKSSDWLWLGLALAISTVSAIVLG